MLNLYPFDTIEFLRRQLSASQLVIGFKRRRRRRRRRRHINWSEWHRSNPSKVLTKWGYLVCMVLESVQREKQELLAEPQHRRLDVPDLPRMHAINTQPSCPHDWHCWAAIPGGVAPFSFEPRQGKQLLFIFEAHLLRKRPLILPVARLHVDLGPGKSRPSHFDTHWPETPIPWGIPMVRRFQVTHSAIRPVSADRLIWHWSQPHGLGAILLVDFRCRSWPFVLALDFDLPAETGPWLWHRIIAKRWSADDGRLPTS